MRGHSNIWRKQGADTVAKDTGRRKGADMQLLLSGIQTRTQEELL